MTTADADIIRFGYINDLTNERVGPQPKQALAHACDAEIVFYGGQAGGGKSEFQIVEAITTCLEFRDIDVAIFRRTNPELEESLILRYHKLVPRVNGKPIASFNASELKATFHDTGSRLWFHSLPHEKTVFNHQSAEWVYLGIDEASHFAEFAVKYLITRVRGGVRRRVVLTSNPGNVGHGWLKRWFMRPVPEELGGRPMPQPYETWRPRPMPDDPTPPDQVMTRCFIPASLDDNPALLRKDPNYRARIYQLGGTMAKQLAEGDWDANDSMIVGDLWKERHTVTGNDEALLAQGLTPGQIIFWHVIGRPEWRPPTEALLYGCVDYGFGAPWAWYVTAAMPGGHTRTFLERYKTRLRDEEQAQLIYEDVKALQDQGYKFAWIVMDPAMWNSRAEMGLAKSIAEVYADILGPLAVAIMPGAKGRGARVSRPNRWRAALSVAPDGLPHWSCTSACANLIRTLPDVPWDPDDLEVEDDDSENHAYEALGRFFEARPHAPKIDRDAAKRKADLAKLDPLSRREAERVEKVYSGKGARAGGAFANWGRG